MGNNSLSLKIGIYSFFSTLLTAIFIFSFSYVFVPSSFYYSDNYKINYLSEQLIDYAAIGNKSNVVKVLNTAEKEGISVYYFEGHRGDGDTSTHLQPIGALGDIEVSDLEFNANYLVSSSSNIVIRENYFVYNSVAYTLAFTMDKYSWSSITTTVLSVVPVALFVSLIFGMMNTIVFSNYISTRIKKAIQKTSNYAHLEFDMPKYPVKNDEFGILVSNIDMMGAKLKVAFDKLNEDLDNSQKLEKQRRDQISIISHELKTPITIIKGQSEMMLANIGKYKNHNLYLQENLKILDKMEELINNMLNTTKLENMDVLVEKQTVNLNLFFTEIVEFLDKLYEDRKIRFSIDKSYEIICNKAVFNQVVKNIVENAIKYSSNNRVEIVILNSKIYISNMTAVLKNDMIEDLYEPFKRLESSRNSSLGGHGIGMYIIKRGLELHGFNYSFTVKDNFATFMIDLGEDIYEKND